MDDYNELKFIEEQLIFIFNKFQERKLITPAKMFCKINYLTISK